MLSLARFAPGLATLRAYKLSYAAADINAGLRIACRLHGLDSRRDRSLAHIAQCSEPRERLGICILRAADTSVACRKYPESSSHRLSNAATVVVDVSPFDGISVQVVQFRMRRGNELEPSSTQRMQLAPSEAPRV